MNDIKELAKWLKDEVEFLKANQDYVGGWYDLGNGLAATVLWEDGWGDEARDDAIQSEANPDWALCAGVMVINKDDTPDGWFMPWDSKTGDLLCETTGITPNEDYDKLASWLLDDFNRLKDADIKSNGETIFGEEEKEPEAHVEEESLKEGNNLSKNLKAIKKAIEDGYDGQYTVSISGNKLTARDGDDVYEFNFNNDGSVDLANIEEVIEDQISWDYLEDTEEERDDFKSAFEHYNSIKDLVNSALPLFAYIKVDLPESCEDCHEECKKQIKEEKVQKWYIKNDNHGTPGWGYDDGRYYDTEEDAWDAVEEMCTMNPEDYGDVRDYEVVSTWKNESCNKEDKKPIKESKEYSTSPYHDIIAEYFDYNGDFEFLDIVASVLGRISNFEDDEDIYQSLDDELIYTYDQWKVLEHYCTPQEANWDSAYSDFMNDVFAICSRIAGTNNNEDDLEEPEEGEED